MDLPSKNMYDTFRDKIWKELEPLDPDWFEALTGQASTNEGNVSDQDDLCANQEGDFKIPFDRTDRTEPFDRTVDSQLFSTPKVFRHARVVSPKTDELSFTAEQEKETSPWAATQSPYLLGMSKEGVQGTKFSGIQPQDIFEGLHTPQKSPVSFAKRISESLGAEIHPDMSWTSSLNTPPALASTLILTKPDESPLPVSVCADQNVVFVRKLFPSLSNASSVGVVPPKHTDMATDYQGVMSPEAAQNPESHDSTQGSLNQGDCVWRQKLPDAIEDGEVRTTVANVLDGAEDVLSIFFTNSSSALRKVKTDRIKRKQIVPTKEDGCSSTDISVTNNDASTEQRTADQEPARLPSPIPAETEDKGITQWSPLSLSEILPSIQDISCCENTPKEVENNIVPEQLQTDSDSSQLVRQHMKITDSGFIKKKRKFVYPIKTSEPQVQRGETRSQRTNTSQGQEVNVRQLVEASVKTDCSSIREDDIQNLRNLAEGNVPPSEAVKVLDFDISQLARDFAQDFTQFPDSAKLSTVAEDPPQNGFSPSACLSAMKRANQKARQANLYQDCDGVSNRRSVSSTNQSISINEGPVSDSGFHSAVADMTHMTASSFVLSSSENKCQSQPWTDVKTNFQRSTPFPSASKGNGKACLDDCSKESETDAKLYSAIGGSQPLDLGRESDLHTESILAQLPSSAKGISDNCIPPNCQVHDSLPEKPTVSLSSIHASGFKTASNKSIQISSATLEKAKHFFEETEGERTFCDQPTECVRSTKDEPSLSRGSVKNTTTFSNQPLSSIEKVVDNNCQLTASQKADVTELCTLLEEADSQFEFTQFKTAKLKQHCQDNASSPQKHDKEFDPDFLAGIDFDDSFSLDAERHPVKVLHDKVTVVSDGKTNCKTSSATSKSVVLLPSSAFKKENPSAKDVSSSSKHISEDSSSNMSTEIITLDTAGLTETSKMKDENPLTLGVGFKTAGGNVLRVSEKCLSKARALFADLEENLDAKQKTLYKQISETELQPQHKSSVDNHTGNFLHHKEEREKVVSSDKEVTGARDEDVRQALSKSASLHGNSSSTTKNILTPSCASSKDFVTSAINKFNNMSEFSTASGKKVSVSADASKKAECLLNDIHTHEDTNKQLKQMEDATRTGRLASEIIGSTPKTGGFQTASGKGVTISSAALKKAKLLLSECDKVEHKISEKPAHFKVPVPGPPPTNGGFLAASGKPVAFSSEALQKAKALFSDISFNAEIPAVSDTSGGGNGSNEKNLSKLNQYQSLAVTFAEDSGKKCTELENGTVERCENHEKMMQSDEIHKRVFRKTLDSTKTVSSQGNPPSVTKPPLSCSASKNIRYSSTNKMSISDGFSTASGKKVSVSDDAMTKAKTLFHENASFGDTNNQPEQRLDIMPQPNNGFQTASGKGVTISSAALKKAKSLLSECDEVDVKISQKPAHFTVPVPGPPPTNGGFLAASGKPVALSSEALQKAKALFGDISFNAEIPAVSETKNCDRKQNNAKDREEIHVGFSTARGAKVHVSQKNLLKAKNLLRDFEDGFSSAKAIQGAEALFKDCDITDNDNCMSLEKRRYGSNEKNLSKFNQYQSLAVTVAEDSGKKCTELENGTVERCENHEKMMQSDEIHKRVFRKTLDSTKTDSSQGNPPSVTKPPLSCSASKNIRYSSTNKMSISDGFSTASGKKVSVSDDAMTKAKSLFHENASFGDTNNQPEQRLDIMPQPNNGFQTASGKGVTISSAALKKAKSLLSECDEVDVKISQKPAHFTVPVPGPPPTNGGFLAASGKPVAFSSEALQKAKALFGDISFNAEIPAVSETKNGDRKQDNAKDREEIHVGFSTAGGAKVHVSQKNLLKAKNLLRDCKDVFSSAKAIQGADAFFKDCDIMDNDNCMSVEKRRYGSNEKNLSKLNQYQSLAVIVAEDSGRKCTELENGTVERCENHEKMMQSDEIHKGVFRNTLDSTKTVSSQGNPPSVTKPSLSCSASKNICYSSTNKMSISDGFSTASGKKVSVSDDAMTKAKSLFHENASFGDTNNQPEQRLDIMPQPNNGFQTASGKGVTISSAALKKTKSLLSECDEVDVKISQKPAHFEVPVPGPSPTNGGFLAASGKPVALSSEALQKAKALFGDISFNAEIPAVSETKNCDRKQNNAKDREEIHVGFSTAGGAKVHVSQKNLLKAKNLLRDFEDGECHNLNSYSSNLTAASDREDMPLRESAPQVVKSLTSLEATVYESETLQNSSAHCGVLIKDNASTDAFKVKDGNRHNSPGAKESNVLNNDQTGSSEESKVKRTEESSLLNIHSLNLSNCSETQHELLAQEAFECTKALLEDESLAGQRLSMTLENLPMESNQKSSNRCVEEPKGKGKRLVEDADMNGQPPLKRRLLEEFDRTVDGPKGAGLHQQISSPNGVMKDRRVFKYSTSLFPNITRPHSNGKNYVEAGLQKTPPTQQLTPGNSISAHPKMSTFVPPFLKSAKTESHKNTVLKDNIRTPSAFVPPFKKQRTVVQESSFTPQREEDKPHHTLVTQFNSNTYVPPSQKTQSTTVTGSKNKQDIQTVTLADNTNDSLNNKNLTVGGGSEDSFAEASCVEDKSRRQDMFQNLHNVELARDMQDMRIRKKKRQVIRPLPGSLFLIKTSGVSRIPLKAAVHGRCPARCTQKQLYVHGVHQHVCEITSETAEAFRFSLQQFVKQETFLEGGGVQLADGGWLIPSNDGTAGKEEFYRALCDTPGVDPKLISEEWVYNHYRWIVWKQASMERSFPETMGSLCLTPEQVLLQLKYRYDVEVDHSRRPALRKIMEKDDTAAKTLVLCVCGVVSRGQSPKRRSVSDTKTPAADARVDSPSAVVWLTDGWYSIKGQLDEPLTAMLHKGRLAVGGKLIIHGAQLVGSQDACSPLEAPDSLMLKICANSSRPARWDAKLGYYRDPRPFLLPVSCLYSNGGPVGCVDIIILRSYPIQWMERKPDGSVVFRSVRAEEKEVRRYNSHKQKSMETLFAKIQAEFERDEKGNNKPKRRRRTITRQDIAGLQDGEELYEAVENDPAYLEAHLSEQQLETLHAYRRSQMERKQAELQDRYRRALENAEDQEGSCPKRDVAPVWRLSITDSMDQPGTVYQLNLWRPPSDLESLLKEGCRYKVYNLTTSDGKKHGGGTTVQLSGTKKTQFQDRQASQEWLSARFQKRVSTHFVDLQNSEFQPLCGEVDLTGYVVSIIDEKGSSPAFYLADDKLNFIKVRCFSSLAQSGLEDVIKPRVLLALSNLQLRGQSTSPTPVVFAGDLTAFSTNPKEAHLQESLSQLRSLVQGQVNFFLTAEEKLSLLVKSDGRSSISTPALQIRTPISATDRRQDTKTSVTLQQPVRTPGPFTPVSRNPLATNGSTERDPVSLKRRRALDYLSRIPSPPPLSHLGSAASPFVKKTFNPPRRSGTPSTLKTVQTPARKPVSSLAEDELVNDEELAMIDTQALL